MHPGSPFGDEPADRGILIYCLEQLDERATGAEARDSGSVHIGELYGLHQENFTTKRSEIFQRFDSDSNVRDSRALEGSRPH
jgi:hypothetical protein